MDWQILYKYVQGNCNEEELRRLGAWLQKDPANEDFFSSFIESWHEGESINFNSEIRTAWDGFRNSHLISDSDGDRLEEPYDMTGPTIEKSPLVTDKKRRRSTGYWLYSAAAVMMLILVLAFVVRQFRGTIASGNGTEISYQEISTVRGQRTNLRLSDGTKVALNANSRLRIPKNYGKEARIILLEGEAFFEVKHDEEHPFIVVTHQTYIKDLGTQFNIMAYDSSHTEVAVKEGLVSLGRVKEDKLQKAIVEITPNKLGVLKEVGGLTVSDIEHMDQHVGWTEGKLVFRSTPFPEVVKRLERWFDIDCRTVGPASKLSKRTLTATYDNMPMSEVLRVFSISMNISYTREDRLITFYSGER